jgi:hypothetical protein
MPALADPPIKNHPGACLESIVKGLDFKVDLHRRTTINEAEN